MSSKYFSKLPRNLHKFFPNIDAIQISNGALTSISAADLAPFPNLMLFAAELNQIETLDGNLFQNTPKLIWVQFNNNLIYHVGANLLSNLNKLQFAYFGNNPCISITAESPQQIEKLKTELIKKCSSFATTRTPVLLTTPADQCGEVKDLNALVEDQRRNIKDLEDVIKEYQKAAKQFCDTIVSEK